MFASDDNNLLKPDGTGQPDIFHASQDSAGAAMDLAILFSSQGCS